MIPGLRANPVRRASRANPVRRVSRENPEPKGKKGNKVIKAIPASRDMLMFGK